MKVRIAHFSCSCGNVFDAPILADFSYGEFLMWSASGQVVYLNAIEDICYSEVGVLVRLNSPQLTSQGAASLQKRIFGRVACDPDRLGEAYQIGGNPRCPYDKSLPSSWELVEPPQFQEVPRVTHQLWNELTSEEKKCRVLDALAQQ